MEAGSERQKMQCTKSEAADTYAVATSPSFSGCARDGLRAGGSARARGRRVKFSVGFVIH